MGFQILLRSLSLPRLLRLGEIEVRSSPQSPRRDSDPEELVNALRNGNVRARTSAAAALGELGCARWVDPLILALHDEAAQVRASAAESLRKVRDARAVDPLIAALQDESEGVRANSAYALGTLGDERAGMFLLKALQDESSNVRCDAAISLAELGDQRAVGPLMKILDDPGADLDHRSMAAMLLGDLDDRQPIALLIRVLNDADSDLRWGAALSLGHLGDSRAINPLIHALKDEDEDVRAVAAASLGALRAREAADPLKRVFQEDADTNVRAVSAWTLLDLGYPESAHCWLCSLGWWDFEIAVLLAFEHAGMEPHATPPSNDAGLDGIIIAEGEKCGIQCKRYAPGEFVGVGDIREFIGAMVVGGIQHGYFATTGQYSNEARSIARDPGESRVRIELLRVGDLAQMVKGRSITPQAIYDAKKRWGVPTEPPTRIAQTPS